MKQQKGECEKNVMQYTTILPDGRMVEIEPEFARMSRRPAIGEGHFDKYKDEIYPRDECIINEKRCKPPRAYDKQLEKADPRTYEQVKKNRRDYAKSKPFPFAIGTSPLTFAVKYRPG